MNDAIFRNVIRPHLGRGIVYEPGLTNSCRIVLEFPQKPGQIEGFLRRVDEILGALYTLYTQHEKPEESEPAQENPAGPSETDPPATPTPDAAGGSPTNPVENTP